MNGERVGSSLHACLRGFPGAVVEVDPGGVVTDSNGKLESLLGREVVGHPFAAALDASSQGKWSRLLGGESSDPTTWEFVLEGRESLELRTFAAVRGSDGPDDRLWLIEYARDLRLERLYEELAAANSELARTQRDLAKERARLARALAVQEAAVRLRDEVLAIVAHDLRSPLDRIAASAAMLRDQSLPRESSRRLLDLIGRTAASTDRLIRDLLDAASIEAGRLSITPVPHEVAPLLQGIHEMFEPRAAEKQVALEWSAATDLPQVSVDQMRIVQVLSNLLNNAIRLTPAGGRIEIRAEPRGEAVRVAVSDTGPGISVEDLPHLFERFWQAQRSRRGSAGLGLAIAKGVIEAHGGRIWAESVEGEGSTFFFTLPSAPEQEE